MQIIEMQRERFRSTSIFKVAVEMYRCVVLKYCVSWSYIHINI